MDSAKDVKVMLPEAMVVTGTGVRVLDPTPSRVRELKVDEDVKEGTSVPAVVEVIRSVDESSV